VGSAFVFYKRFEHVVYFSLKLCLKTQGVGGATGAGRQFYS